MVRLLAVILKELRAAVRDPKARFTIIVPPFIQLFVFTFAATLEVNNVDVGVLDRSGGAYAAEFTARIAGSTNFDQVVRLRSYEELEQAIDRQQVLAAIVFPSDVDRQFVAGRSSTVGLVLDGRRMNASQAVAGYVQRIAAGIGADLVPGTREPPMGSIVTHWFNPNLEYRWFILPGLLVIISAVSGLAVTAQTVARERELGTFDQLMVSPLRTHEVLVGKMVPPLLIGLLNATVYLLAARFVFGVPFTGSLVAFYTSLVVFLLALIGIGMFISSLSKTQQQAFLGAFFVTVPLTLLSGFATPVDNMPEWLQMISVANPARWFFVISEGLFLKSLPAAEVFANTFPLLIIAVLTLSAAAWLFRARME